MSDKIIWEKKECGIPSQKTCFCIGPANCNDTNCKLVQEHRKFKGQIHTKA